MSGTPSLDALSVGSQLAAVRVIGPAELVIGGRAVGLRSSRTRRLVAMLALYRDRVVSSDRLIDAVWGESLPADPTGALQSQLSRLRSSLGSAAVGVETVSGGYRLRSDVIAVDVARFDALIAAARDGSRPADERTVLLDEAIGMVRGAAFEDLDVDDASIEARRLAGLVTGAHMSVATAAFVEARLPTRRVPAPLIDLVGREDDLRALAALLAGHRIVTLTGPGGVGKTALALAAVRQHAADAGVRDAFVDLAPVPTPDGVPDAFARALGVERPGDEPWRERLAEAITRDPLVLLVDNAEHVGGAAAEMVAELVAHTGIAVVATSRVPLNVPGEQLWVVEPLDVNGAALDLFGQRARAVRPEWAVTREDDASVREICRRVDGLPLAIELAAAQLRWRTAAEVSTSLERPLDALDPVDAGAGRAGLRSVIEPSYGLLEVRQQAFFDQLGVFVGGFTAETAAAVTGGDVPAIRQIGSLVQHSLVRATPSVTGTRYSLLDMVRHFAMEGLDRRGGATAARDRHAAALLALTERAHREMWGPGEAAWVARLDDERADVCAAHRHLLAIGDTEAALRLATAAYWVAWPRGWSDLRGLIRTTVADKVEASAGVLALAFGTRADFALHADEGEAVVGFVERARQAAGGRPELAYLAEGALADLALFSGRTKEAEAVWQAAADGYALAWPGVASWAVAASALALVYGGRITEGAARAAEAVTSADRSGCATVRAFARYAAGEAAAAQGADQAAAWFAEALTTALSVRAAFVANLAQLSLATNLARLGQPALALVQYPAVLQGWRRSGQWTQQWITLRTLVPVLVAAGAAPAAAVILGGLRGHGQADTWGTDADSLRDVEAQLGPDLDEQVARGAAMTPAELVEFAEEASAAGAGLGENTA